MSRLSGIIADAIGRHVTVHSSTRFRLVLTSFRAHVHADNQLPGDPERQTPWFGGLRLARDREERGAIAVVVAFFAVVAFRFAAIVVDLGYARSIKAKAQDAADSAALGGRRGRSQAVLCWTPDFGVRDAVQNKANGVLGFVPWPVWAVRTLSPFLGPMGCVSFDTLTSRCACSNTNFEP